MQDYTSNNKIKENKYKILRMSLLLGSDENREETLNNFEDAACEIDAMNDEIYLKDLEDKFYETTTLEEEEKKLANLVDYIGGRVEQRISLLTDFANVTGFDLQNLPPIKYYDRLDDYKERLKYIQEYLNNTNRLNILNQELNDVSEKLDKAYKNKAVAEEFNLRNEEILFNKFQNIVKTLDYFKDINKENIEEKLNNTMQSVEESKKSLDIFTKSFTTLAHSGISIEEEQEYRSYVINAQDVYYANKEKEYIMQLYLYLVNKEGDYNSILKKRDNISKLLYERLTLRKQLNIKENDILDSLYELLERQFEDIKHQKENIEDIEKFNELIQTRKEEINTLEMDNQKVEILAILREYGIIETYSEPATESVKTENIESTIQSENDSFETPESQDLINTEPSNNNDFENSFEEVKEDTNFMIPELSESDEISEKIEEETTKEIEEALDNQIIAVEDAKNIDLDLVHLKANKVMQRVGEMLGIRPKEEKIISITNEQPVNNDQLEHKNNDQLEHKNNDQLEHKIEEQEKKEEIPENPLFSSEKNIESTNSQEVSASKGEDVEENSFWFPSDTPDALNELPDLETSNNSNDNFFANNEIPNLDFPDLKIDFGSNDTEA